MKKSALIISTLIIVTLVLSLIRIYVSNNVSTSGIKLESLQQSVDSYKLQNTILSEKLYEESSLTSIAQKAEKIGYSENKKEYVINGTLPVAFKQ